MRFQSIGPCVGIMVCLLLFRGGAPVCAADTEIVLTLDDSIDRALRENLSLRSAAMELPSGDLSIEQARAQFDPSFSVDVNRSKSVRPNFYDYIAVSSVESESSALNLTLGKRIATGADIGFGFYNTLSVSNIEKEKNYTSNLGFTLTQPLLRGFGAEVNRSRIYAAQSARETTGYAIISQATDLVAEMQRVYWNLLYARQTADVLAISVAQAESLLSYNEAGERLGVKTESDVLEARSELVARRQEILSQENNVRSYEDQFRRLLNTASDSTWEGRIVPSDLPEIVPVDRDLAAAVETAKLHRPEYLSALASLEEQKRLLRTTGNARLPNLDFSAGYRLNSSGQSYGKNLGQLDNTDAYGWNVGLNLSYPIGNRDAKAADEKQAIALRQAQLNLDDLVARITVELKESIRAIGLASEQIDVAILAVEVNELKLRNEEERLANNLTSSYYVLEYQRDLADARNRYNRAVIDYLLAVSDFQKAKGTLLAEHQISIVGGGAANVREE